MIEYDKTTCQITDEKLRGLWQAVCLAQEMGPRLAACQILLGTLSEREAEINVTQLSGHRRVSPDRIGTAHRVSR